MKDANPLSYAEIVSPFLNLYSEPREFIDDAARAAFEPIAFFGSLAPSLREGPAAPVFSPSRRGLRVYVSFGTVIWRYFEAAALAALSVIAHTLGDLDADVVIGLGRRPLDGTALAALRRPNVRVVDYADQWTALQEADVFVTHHGLNSTHEGIFHEVPMLSYPFFGDQPAQARRCQELGLAVPLVDTPRAPLVPDALRSALTRVAEERAALGARLAEARSWELRTMADRGAIVRRMLSLSSR